LEFVGASPTSTIDEIMGVGHEEESLPEIDLVALEEEEGELEEEKAQRLEKQKQAKQAKLGKPVITYVSRQEWGRRMLLPAGHDSLVKELKELEKKYGWEVSLVFHRSEAS
jgi:hypothetical protein